MNHTKKIITAALLAAFTCIATMIIKLPTPTFGYIHLGDGLVLLSGFILGPVLGAFAAGIGSMFADIFSGYITWAPATFIIKALTAMLAGFIFRKLPSFKLGKNTFPIIISGACGEIIMVVGYFIYEAFLAAFANGSFDRLALGAGLASSATGIPFNIAQGIVGILISLLLMPVLKKVPDVNDWLKK